jgi:hypothetical protein
MINLQLAHNNMPASSLPFSHISRCEPIVRMISNHNKRRTQPSASSSRVVEDDISTRLFKLQDDREKEDEELDLEASLFGKKRKRAGRGSRGSGIGKSKAKAEQEEMVGEDMGMPGVFWEDKGDDVGMSSGGNADEVSHGRRLPRAKLCKKRLTCCCSRCRSDVLRGCTVGGRSRRRG